MKEMMIVSDVRKNPATMADATKTYAQAMISNLKFLLAYNDQMTKDL